MNASLPRSCGERPTTSIPNPFLTELVFRRPPPAVFGILFDFYVQAVIAAGGSHHSGGCAAGDLGAVMTMGTMPHGDWFGKSAF